MSDILIELRNQLLKKVEDGISQTKISQDTGVQQSSISRFLKKGDSLSGDNVITLLKYLDAQVVYNNIASIQRIGANSPLELVYGADIVSIPVYSHAGAGNAFDFAVQEPEYMLQVLKEYALPELKAIRIIGNSMEPTIKKGSFVGVIPFSNYNEGSIYLIYDCDMGLTCKRIRKSREGLMLYSDNKEYEPIPLTDAHEIQGEVVWVWQMV